MGAGVAYATSGTPDSRFDRCQHAGNRHDRHPDAAAPLTSNLLIPAAMNVLFPSGKNGDRKRKQAPRTLRGF